MSRVALCLFFIAIFQYGVQKSSQINSSTEVSTEESKNNNVTTKETIKDPEIKDTESKKDDDVTPDEPKKGKKITNESKDDKNTKPKESKKEKNVSSEATERTGRSESTPKQLDPGFLFNGNIFLPVMKARAQISEAVSKGVDGAKDIADGAYNFLRNAATSLF